MHCELAYTIVGENTSMPGWCGRSKPLTISICQPAPGERCESLVNKILRRTQVTDAHQDSAQAIILRPAVELREVQSLGSHTYSTHNRRTETT